MKYFIQNGFVGNDALWWRKNCAGYTTDIDDAEQFGESDKHAIVANRAEDVAFPVEAVMNASHRAVAIYQLREIS